MSHIHREEGGTAESTGRLEAFSDGVFAIAITLLVLEIAVPHVAPDQDFGHALRAQWPSYFAYVVSFVVIGVMWMNHKALYRDVARPDHTSSVLNLALLMCIAFIPFPTALLAEYVREGHHEVGAVTVYGTTLTVTALVFNALWFYIAYAGRLLHDDVSLRRVRSRTLRYLPGPVLYALTIGAAYISIWLALALYAGLAVLYLLPTPE